jgi:hypothetical protein
MRSAETGVVEALVPTDGSMRRWLASSPFLCRALIAAHNRMTHADPAFPGVLRTASQRAHSSRHTS